MCALLEDDNVKILNILESETNAEDEGDKFNRVDLLVQDSQKRKIYIEIQNTREADYLESLLYASSKIIVEHQKLGSDFSDLSKVISISILYFNLGIGDDYIYYGNTEFKGLNTGGKLIVKKRVNLSEAFEPKYRFVEKNIFPEYYLIIVERYKNIVKKKIDEWIYMIKNNEVAKGSVSKNIDKAQRKLAEMNMTTQERKRYEKYLINLARDRGAMNTAKEEGYEEGRIAGEIKGKIEVAKSLKTKGIPIEIIMETTGLTEIQVNEL
ncbi:conserved hypothetical protein [Gammaproteobacteria bacterium]